MAAAKARVQDTQTGSRDIDLRATADLAQACVEQGRYDEALQHYRKVLRRVLALVGPDHEIVADLYNKYVSAWLHAAMPACMRARSFGEVYRLQLKFDKAMDYYKRSLDITKRMRGADELVVATTQNKYR